MQSWKMLSSVLCRFFAGKILLILQLTAACCCSFLIHYSINIISYLLFKHFQLFPFHQGYQCLSYVGLTVQPLLPLTFVVNISITILLVSTAAYISEDAQTIGLIITSDICIMPSLNPNLHGTLSDLHLIPTTTHCDPVWCGYQTAW